MWRILSGRQNQTFDIYLFQNNLYKLRVDTWALNCASQARVPGGHLASAFPRPSETPHIVLNVRVTLYHQDS